MLTIYHLNVSQSDRIVWLMEELGLPYNLERFDRMENMLAPPEYRALHPVATSPTIRDGDLVMCESIAIVEYIINRYGNGRFGVDKDQANYPHYLYWMQFSTSFLSAILMNLTAKSLSAGSDNRAVSATHDRIHRHFRQMEQRLSECAYLAGEDFTAADMQNLFTLTTMPRFGGPGIDAYPSIQSYVERVTARPAYQKAMQIAGPDTR